MRQKASFLIALSFCTGMMACGESSSHEEEQEEGLLLGPNRSYAEALDIADALQAETLNIVYAEGPTRLSEMPVSGTALYRGVITGWAESGFPVNYVADLTLEMEFDGQDVSGSISNVMTDALSGLVRPAGEIDLDGFIVRNTRTDKAFHTLNGSGPLYWLGQEAILTISGSGGWVGDDARAIRGGHSTEFRWTQGLLADTVSTASGEFSAIRAD